MLSIDYPWSEIDAPYHGLNWKIRKILETFWRKIYRNENEAVLLRMRGCDVRINYEEEGRQKIHFEVNYIELIFSPYKCSQKAEKSYT